MRRTPRGAQGEWWDEADAAVLATIEQPALLVMAADSPSEFHRAPEAPAAALRNARLSRVGGGQLSDPASPKVVVFIEEFAGSGGRPR